jgi:hypothetical protein
MTHKNDALDPVYSADRNGGSTEPETNEESSNIVGRPDGPDDDTVGFHEGTETPAVERESFSGEEAVRDGGSFDGLGLPVADDSEGRAGRVR